MPSNLVKKMTGSVPLSPFKGNPFKDQDSAMALTVAILCLFLAMKLVGSKTPQSLVFNTLTRLRRSVMKFSGPPTPGAVDRALIAAIHAPNHFLNEPWRFRILGKQAIEKICCLNENKRELFAQVPLMLMVSVVPTAAESGERWNPKSLEDHAATACATQNFMLSLASEGVGSKWMTGALGIPGDRLLKLVGANKEVANEEHFMGLVFVGKPSTRLNKMKIPPRKIGLEEPVLTKYD